MSKRTWAMILTGRWCLCPAALRAVALCPAGRDDNAKEWYTRTYAIPAHATLQSEGLDYAGAGANPSVSDGLKAFAAMAGVAARETPQAYQLQGSPNGFKVYNATVKYLAGALNGDLSLDEAIAKIKEDVAQ